MPHVSEMSASHEAHDPMVMAALAAGDLAGTDRDQALARTRSCPDCAALRDDLVAIATATAQLPPPIPAPARDFRLSPEQAARLRPAGWRRFFGPAQRGSLTRPLGVALATFGIAGLLIGTLPLGGLAGGSASTAAPAPAGSSADRNAASAAAGAAAPEGAVPGASAAAAASEPAASTAQLGPVASAAASAAAIEGPFSPAPTGGSDVQGGEFGGDGSVAQDSGGVGIAAAGSPKATADSPNLESLSGTQDQAASSGSSSPLVILSVIAIVLGLALLIVARRRERDPV
jgi:hypothetical protein